MGFKLHGIKLHTPTFHLHGEKYKVGYWGRFAVGLNSKGKLSGKWRTGWRQHDHGGSDFVDSDDYRSGDVVGLLHPTNSARRLAFQNQARFEYV